MPRNGSGVAVKAVSDFVASTIISESDMNLLVNDMIDMLTQSVSRDGQTVILNNIPMSTKIFTGLGNGAAATDSANLGQVQSEATTWAGVATGTADALLLTPTPAITAYAAGQRFVFVASASPNTGAVTVNVNSVGVKAVENASTALIADDIDANIMYQIIYDGTAFQIMKIAL